MDGNSNGCTSEIQFDMQKNALIKKPEAFSVRHLRGEEGERSLDQQTHQPLRVEDELVTAGLLVSEGGGKRTNIMIRATKGRNITVKNLNIVKKVHVFFFFS